MNPNNPMIKYLLSLCLLLALLPAARAQMGFNSPVDVKPTTDFEFYARDGLLVQQKYQYAKGVPESSVNTMSCLATPPILTATAGILKDPSGDANYTGGISYSCTQTISVPNVSTETVIGIELIFDDFDTTPQGLAPPTDYVNILNKDNRIMYVLTGQRIPERHIISGNTIRIQFITNNDASVGRGFQLRWRAVVRDDSGFGVYESRTVGPIAFGHSMKFDVYWGALSAGLDNLNYGYYSTVFGSGNKTNGHNNFVAGRNNTAEWSTDQVMVLGEENNVAIEVQNATALGAKNVVRASNSTAIGDENTINSVGYGFTPANAIAIGKQNTTSGIGSIAIGYLNTASGNYSTAMGHRMSTNGQAGAFMIGDTDPLGQGTTGAGAADQFVARFRNGYYLMTSGTSTRTGVVIGAGQNAWSAISDSTRKERFLPMNHTQVLQKINAMKLTSWNYKGQREIRHYGPMAQDFYAAFGHDALGQVGCDTLINSHDFAGVTFAAVQALIRENEQLKMRLHLLERAMLTRRERVAMRKTKP
jgi:hypothetical protein